MFFTCLGLGNLRNKVPQRVNRRGCHHVVQRHLTSFIIKVKTGLLGQLKRFYINDRYCITIVLGPGNLRYYRDTLAEKGATMQKRGEDGLGDADETVNILKVLYQGLWRLEDTDPP